MNNSFFELLSIVLNNKDDIIELNDWPEILKELSDQAVIALPFDYAQKFGMDSELLSAYKSRVLLNVTSYLKIVAIQNVVLNKLAQEGIKAVVLKGTSAAKYYIKPEYRTMGDIDILVAPSDFDKAYSVIQNSGFETLPDEDANPRHIGFQNNQGIEIELHRYFSNVGTKKQREYLDNRIYEAIRNNDKGVLPEVENGLVLIAHVAQHLRTGLGLRQIIDWMMYVKANLTDEFWKSEFSEKARNCGFDKLAMVTTALCKKYLGLNENITWCDDVDDALVDNLMEYIFDQGNFGRKYEYYDRKTVTVLNNFRSPIALIKYLQDGGKSNWRLARQNRFVGCFAWLYQICHLIKMSVIKRVGVKELMAGKKESQGIVDLLDDLEIKEY